jgi:uncharacterized membrane protein YdjX (TVP38/TMEM64 family)
MMLSKLLNNRRFWLAIALLSAVLLCCFTPVRVLFDKMLLVQKLQHLGHWSVCLYVLIYTVATIFGVPGTILAVAAGTVFGLFWGTLWSVVGATLGAIGAFLVARYLFHNWAERKFGHHKALIKFKKAVSKKPIAFVLAVRFTPVSPFNVVNFLFGLTPIRCRDYAIGTFFGIIPGTLAYTWLGVTGEKALNEGELLPFFMALAFLALLSLLPILAKKKGIGNG